MLALSALAKGAKPRGFGIAASQDTNHELQLTAFGNAAFQLADLGFRCGAGVSPAAFRALPPRHDLGTLRV